MLSIPPNELKAVWHFTQELHQRFFPDNPPSFRARYRVFLEEVAELTLDLTDNGENEAFVALEAADVLVTLVGLLQGYGIEYEEFSAAIVSVINKNNAKTLLTHFVRSDGKIARRKDSVST